MRILRVFVAFVLVLVGVVSSVGSGGGGGADEPDFYLTGKPPPPGFITVANAQDVAAMVVRGDYQALDVMTKIGGQVFPTLPSAPDLVTSKSKYELFATVVATGQPVTETCAVSGTVTVSSGQPYNYPSGSEKDTFVLVFDTCDDGDGYTLDGSFWLIVYSLNGDPRTDVFSLIYDVKDMTLTIVSGMEKYPASGSELRLEWNSVDFPEIALTIESDPLFTWEPTLLQLSSQAGAYSLHLGRETLMVNADMSVSTTLREIGISSVKSTLFPSGVQYSTKVPLQAPDGQNPQSGTIHIWDTDTSIYIVIESSDVVRLDIDLDRDGMVDEIQYTTWAAVRG